MSAAAAPLFAAAGERQLRADHLLPSDRIRHRGRTLRLDYVAVTPGELVRLRARTISGTRVELEISGAEQVTVVP